MTSRERVLTAFAHEEPDRVLRWCGASDEFWAKAKQKLNVDALLQHIMDFYLASSAKIFDAAADDGRECVYWN